MRSDKKYLNNILSNNVEESQIMAYYFLLFLPTKTIGIEIKEDIYHDNEHETVGSRHTRK